MATLRIDNALMVHEEGISEANIFIKDSRIFEISGIQKRRVADTVIDSHGKTLIPGAIDDQVHFREPGLTHKADLFTESRAAVAGGVTSYMEMPNTVPGATTIKLLEEKYSRAAQVSLANYSFFMGTTNHNFEEVMAINPKDVCGVKIFMGSSTGDMLVDNQETLERFFANVPTLIATHCEDDVRIKNNLEVYKQQYGISATAAIHPLVRDRIACYNSSSKAVEMAKKFGTRLHVLHISTKEELALFSNDKPLIDKLITAEACMHHLWFSDEDYAEKGNFIKWNPSIKTTEDRAAIRAAVVSGLIDVMATDHAPHTLQEKGANYWDAPSGGPLVQHSVLAALDLVDQGVFTLPLIVEKMCHNPAILFQIQDRGYIREQFFADLVLVEAGKASPVKKENVLSKCGWSPFEAHVFNNSISKTIVNGNVVFDNGKFYEQAMGARLKFNR